MILIYSQYNRPITEQCSKSFEQIYLYVNEFGKILQVIPRREEGDVVNYGPNLSKELNISMICLHRGFLDKITLHTQQKSDSMNGKFVM